MDGRGPSLTPNISSAGGILSLQHCRFVNNNVSQPTEFKPEFFEPGFAGGGAVFVNDGGRVNISAGTFERNSASLEGISSTMGAGGAFSLWGRSQLRVQGPALFVENSAGYGGAVHGYDGCTVKLTGGLRFERNFAALKGGAVSWRNFRACCPELSLILSYG